MDVRGGARDGEWCPDNLTGITDKFPGRSERWFSVYRRHQPGVGPAFMRFVGYFPTANPPLQATAIERPTPLAPIT